MEGGRKEEREQEKIRRGKRGLGKGASKGASRTVSVLVCSLIRAPSMVQTPPKGIQSHIHELNSRVQKRLEKKFTR